MSGSGSTATSRRIAAEKNLKYLGTVSVELASLRFQDTAHLDLRNVQRLCRLFEGEHGCLPEQLEHRIPATISEDVFIEALALSGLSSQQLLLETPIVHSLNLPNGIQLECLRGLHRVEAAKQILPLRKQRWGIDLYASSECYQPGLLPT